MNGSRSPHATGLMIMTAGVLILSPDSLVLRLISVDHWTILTWRGLGLAVGMLGVYWLGWARGRLRKELVALGRAGLLTSVLFATDNVLFVTAITHTAVANTLLILSAGPLFAALLSWVFLRERVPARTWAAIVVVVAAVVLIVSGSLGHGRLAGDLAALGASLSLAGTFVAIRRSRARNMMPAAALGGLIGALAASPLADLTAPGPRDAALLLFAGLVLLPAALGLITLGPRYLPAPEVSLLMLLETALGPIWVWFVLREVPPTLTLIGGVIVLATLATHAVLGIRQGVPVPEPRLQ